MSAVVRQFVVVAALLLARRSAAAPATVLLREGFEHRSVGLGVDVALDATEELTIDDVRAGRVTFAPSVTDVPSFGPKRGTMWAHFRIEDERPGGESLVLEQAHAQSDVVSVYVDGAPALRSGDHVPIDAWPIRAREPAFPLAAGSHDVVVELRGGMTKQLPLNLYTAAAYTRHLVFDHVAQGLYFGVILALALYNLGLFVSTRLKVYGLYGAAMLTYAASQLAIHGVGYELLWGRSGTWNDRAAIGWTVLFPAFATVFVREILALETRAPAVFRALGAVAVLFGVLAGPLTAMPFHLATRATGALAIAWSFVVFAASLREALRGQRVARIVTVAWTCLLAGMVLMALRVVGVLPANAMTKYGPQVGSLLEALLLSLALADRIKELQAEVVAQSSSALANANAALAAREQAMRELEERRRVQGELDVATQQLTQAENMATLGMLMAGIAHDLRNPLNYVQGAAEQLRAAIPNLQSDDEAVRAKTLGRVEKVVGWVEQGTASMDAISLAMRNQARSGGAELSEVNVGEVVGEALLLCRSRTKVCEVEVDVQDASVRADATGLGQLVMNLVSNAADAITEAKEKDPAQETKIRVSARVEGDAFMLAVEDSGPGIPEHVRARILEPFFTTKPRGQGTVLGLAIVQRVVKQHGGALEIGRSDALGGASFRAMWRAT